MRGRAEAEVTPTPEDADPTLPERLSRWPRFVEGEVRSSVAPLVGAREPWPRWGWFPQEPRTWTFAPSPSLTARSSAEEVGEHRPAATPEIEADQGRERTTELVPVRRIRRTDIVPVRRELALADASRVARQVAPAAAIVGLAAAAVLTFLGRK